MTAPVFRFKGVDSDTRAFYRPLTFAGTGIQEADAQISLAMARLESLRRELRESLDSQRDLPNRVAEILHVLIVAVSCVDEAGGADRCVSQIQRFLVSHAADRIRRDKPT